MPNFTVVFSCTVVDQPDHHRARKEVDRLVVLTETPQGAFFHAARVTRGDGQPVAVYDEAGQRVYGEGPETITLTPPPPRMIEVPQDRTEVFGA